MGEGASEPGAAAGIRIATPADAAGVVRLVRAFRDQLEAATPTDEQLAARLPAALADPSLEFAWAWLAGEAVGYTQTRFVPSIWSAGVEAHLEDLFVLAAERGRGIGRMLLRHALARARERGARALTLTTNERNQPAQRLYRAEGLRPRSEKVWGGGREVRWHIDLAGS